MGVLFNAIYILSVKRGLLPNKYFQIFFNDFFVSNLNPLNFLVFFWNLQLCSFCGDDCASLHSLLLSSSNPLAMPLIQLRSCWFSSRLGISHQIGVFWCFLAHEIANQSSIYNSGMVVFKLIHTNSDFCGISTKNSLQEVWRPRYKF